MTEYIEIDQDPSYLKGNRIPEIATTDSDWDDALTGCIKRARVMFIDPYLGEVTDVPLTGDEITEAVKEINADIAAGLWAEDQYHQSETDIINTESVLKKRGIAALEQYRKQKYEVTGRTARITSGWRRSCS